MTIRHSALFSTMARGRRGFSMIDVLVAIVVLATGLLALAALQGALTRNGADARARSQIAAYTESLIDRMRFAGYDTVAPSTAFAQGQVINPSSTLPSSPTLAQQMAYDGYLAQSAAGVSNLKVTINTAVLYCGTSGSTFSTASACTAINPANYKQLELTSTWTDATGQSRSLKLDTAVSQVTVSTGNNTVDNATFGVPTGSAPVVREVNPSNTAGVIPIAISSSASSAATNPAPVVTNTGTTFSTFTYSTAASALGGNVISQRVDTKMIQCSCKYGGPISSDSNLSTAATGTTPILQQPYGPTYWDGTQYVSPIKQGSTTGTTLTASQTGINSSATQDADCDICCRDHNDPTGDGVLFDNYSPNHNHYAYNNSTGTWNVVASSGADGGYGAGIFGNVCRMIRVGGVYATATDVQNAFFGLLPTDTCTSTGIPTGCTNGSNTASSPVPKASAETAYASFVKNDYLYPALPNLRTGASPPTAPTDPQASNTISSAYAADNLTITTSGGISITTATGDNRWLHARGLYIDHLETSAWKALDAAITNCSATDQTSVENCAYPVLPFTTVNMTELANWSSPNNAAFVVHDTTDINGNDTTPARGEVNQATTGTGYATAVVGMWNSGLTAVPPTFNSSGTLLTTPAISSYDYSNTLTDRQQFTVSGSSGSGSNTVYFNISLSNLPWVSSISSISSDPIVAWSETSASTPTTSYNYLTSTGSGTHTVYSPLYVKAPNGTSYTPNTLSTSSTPPVGLVVTVRQINTSTAGSAVSTACTYTNSSGVTTTSTTTKNVNSAVCTNYAIAQTGGSYYVQVNGTNVPVNTPVLWSDTSTSPATSWTGLKEGFVVTIPSSSSGLLAASSASPGSIVIPFTQVSQTTVNGTCTCGSGIAGGGGCQGGTNTVAGVCPN